MKYTIHRKSIKNIHLRVRGDGSVHVSAPWGVSRAAVEAFVASNAVWIAGAQARAQAFEAVPLPTPEEALAHMTALCRRYYPQFRADCPGGAFPKVKVCDMTTRWGSCSLRTGTLAFSLRLCTMPLAAQEYVVVHEFCHFAHPDHSPAFWAEVARHLPDYAARRALLKGGPAHG